MLTPSVYSTLREEGYQYLLLTKSVKDKDMTYCLYDAIKYLPKMCDIERAVALDNDILAALDSKEGCDVIYISYDLNVLVPV
jgi:hypothetical protein